MWTLSQILSFVFLFSISAAASSGFKDNAITLPGSLKDVARLHEHIVEIDGQRYFLSGDMLIEEDLLVKRPPLQGAILDPLKPWPNGVVPIRFHKDVDQSFQKWVWQACKEWGQYGQVTCRPAQKGDNELYVTARNWGCWATLGQNTIFGFKRRMNLQPDGCQGFDIALHEMGHALGLIHEHQRVDRDKYVEIVDENISGPIGVRFNFKIMDSKLYGPYDFFSIMHYGYNFFSRDGYVPTIQPRQPYSRFKSIIGRQSQLSPLDQYAIGALYGRTKNTPTLEQAIKAVYGN